MKRLGWEENYINDVMKLPISKRPSFTVTLIEDPGNLVVPTWKVLEDETLRLLSSNDLSFNKRIKQIFPDYVLSNGEIDTNKLSEVFRSFESVYYDEINKLPPNYRLFRRLLESKFANNTFFSSRGFTITPDGKFGLREWVLSKPELGFELQMMREEGFNMRKFNLGWE